MSGFQIYSLGEQAVTVRFGQAIDDNIHRQVLTLAASLEEEPLHGLLDIVPSYCAMTVYYDLMATNYEEVHQTLINRIRLLNGKASTVTGKTVEIPVCYGSSYGPDLTALAARHQLSEEEVVRLHAEARYKVYMIGFAPGFPYLGGLPVKLATPRLDSPRSMVPAGSVGIADCQTGVYPLETPGGWNIIGQTPLKLFDPQQQPPSLLKAGDMVRFIPVSEQEFNELEGKQS